MGPRCAPMGKDRLQEFRAPFAHSLWFSFPGHPPPHLFRRLFNLSSCTRCVLGACNELSVQERAPPEGTVFHGTPAANPIQALDCGIFPGGVDPADAKPPSQPLGSAKTGSLCKVRPGVLGDIHQQTIWGLWDPAARCHLPTAAPRLPLWDSVDCSQPGFSAQCILQVSILQWGASRPLFQGISRTRGLYLGLPPPTMHISFPGHRPKRLPIRSSALKPSTQSCCPPSWKPSLQKRLSSCPLLLRNLTREGFSVHLLISFSVFCWTTVVSLPFFFVLFCIKHILPITSRTV